MCGARTPRAEKLKFWSVPHRSMSRLHWQRWPRAGLRITSSSSGRRPGPTHWPARAQADPTGTECSDPRAGPGMIKKKIQDRRNGIPQGRRHNYADSRSKSPCWARPHPKADLHSTDDGPESPKPVCSLIKELKPMSLMCQSRFYSSSNPLSVQPTTGANVK